MTTPEWIALAVIVAGWAFMIGYVVGAVRERQIANTEREARLRRILDRARTACVPLPSYRAVSFDLHPHHHATSYATLDELLGLLGPSAGDSSRG